MSKKQEFINFINQVFTEYGINSDSMPENVRLYWEVFCGSNDTEKPMFTDNGKLVLQFLKDHQETSLWKARDIAEGLFISSRTVSGAMRKLVGDGFVEKVGSEPTIYSLTELGKNVEIK